MKYLHVITSEFFDLKKLTLYICALFYENIKFPCISFYLILHSCWLLQGELVSSFDMDSYGCDRSEYCPCYRFNMEKTTKQG